MNEDYLQALNALSRGTLMESLGIEILESAGGRIVGKMPVDARTVQPLGFLHGGATAALVETLGSLGSFRLVDPGTVQVFGVDLHISHLKAVRGGWVTGVAQLLKEGRRVHFWEVKVFNEEGEVCATGKLTVMVAEKK